jgi:hypothetical protein
MILARFIGGLTAKVIVYALGGYIFTLQGFEWWHFPAFMLACMGFRAEALDAWRNAKGAGDV